MIGPYPPPSGGISIHIERLVCLLEDFVTIEVVDFSFKLNNKIRYIHLSKTYSTINKLLRADIWHIHSGNRTMGKILILLSILFRKKTIITLHGFGSKFSQRWGHLTNLIFSFSDRIIAVHPDIAMKNSFGRDLYIIQPAFIPPFFNDMLLIPKNISKILSLQRKNGKQILIANASKDGIGDSNDIYGTDLLFQLAELIEQSHLFYHVILIISDRGLNNNSINLSALSNDFISVFYQDISFVALIKECDVVLRPTRADGDALTIREAICFNKPVIASDIVSRPKGTILFKTNDVNDLFRQIQNVEKLKIKYNKPHSEVCSIEYYREKYLKIYTDVFRK